MAIYTSIDALARRLDAGVLAGLADDSNSPPVLTAPQTVAVLEQAIRDGASLIDSYLLGRANLADPLTAAMLERMNATLALYYLYRRRYLDDARNPLSAAQEMVQAQLHAIARGEARLEAAAGERPGLEVLSTTADTERAISHASLGIY
jgi:phage gp36-like protein